MRYGSGLLLLARAGLATAGILAASASAATQGLAGVSAANSKTVGMAAPNILSRGLIQTPMEQGSMKLEYGTSAIP
jgi:hypothetical protein